MVARHAHPANAAEAMAEYQRRNGIRDLPGLLELIDDTAVYWHSNATAHVGKPAVEAAIRANFDGIEDDTYAPYDLEWLVETQDVAVCVYGFRWTGRIDGREASGSGRGTSVLARREGRWLIVHEHLSRGAPRP